MSRAEIKSLAQAIRDRRASQSFDGEPMPPDDLRKILEAGLQAPSSYNLQPWRFIVVQQPEQKRRLRGACFNQAKVEEASAVIVACGDADAWRKDLDEVINSGLRGGMSESLAAASRESIPHYFAEFNSDQMHGWLNKQVMVAFTHMLLMAEVLGYDTAPMEGFEQEKVHEVLRLPMSYWVVAVLALGRMQGPDKFNGGRFPFSHTVFCEEFGKPLK
jgi:nitroreductase